MTTNSHALKLTLRITELERELARLTSIISETETNKFAFVEWRQRAEDLTADRNALWKVIQNLKDAMDNADKMSFNDTYRAARKEFAWLDKENV